MADFASKLREVSIGGRSDNYFAPQTQGQPAPLVAAQIDDHVYQLPLNLMPPMMPLRPCNQLASKTNTQSPCASATIPKDSTTAGKKMINIHMQQPAAPLCAGTKIDFCKLPFELRNAMQCPTPTPEGLAFAADVAQRNEDLIEMLQCDAQLVLAVEKHGVDNWEKILGEHPEWNHKTAVELASRWSTLESRISDLEDSLKKDASEGMSILAVYANDLLSFAEFHSTGRYGQA